MEKVPEPSNSEGKHKLITEISDSMKAFKAMLRLWEDQLCSVSELKSLETIFPELNQEYSWSIFLLRKVLDE
jgi:hypothetical protein